MDEMSMLINQGYGLIHYAEADGPRSWSFDKRGLLRAAVREGVKFKRGFSGQLQEIKLKPVPGVARKHARFLDKVEKEEMLENLHREAQKFCEKEGEGEGFRRLTGCFDLSKYRRNEERFREIWGTIPILPPDQYRALVFNFTSGCSYNRCNFCDFYSGADFAWKTEGQFREHIEAGLTFFAETLPFFTEVFIGAGDLLSAPPAAVAAAIDELRSFPQIKELPVHCFGPGFLARRCSEKQLSDLAAAGLKRVYFGLESGSADVLKKLGKPFGPDMFLESVELCRRAGLDVGVIVLLGAGGREYYSEHIEQTVQVLNKIAAGNDDRIFLSPLAAGKIGWSAGGRLEALNEKEKIKQSEAIKKGIDTSLSVAGYEVENFMY